MYAVILITTALILNSMTASTLETQITKCQHVREQCMTAENGCGSAWNLVEKVCFISGNKCTVKDSTHCNIVIQFLVDQFPEFNECMCTEDTCSSKTFQAKQCSSHEGGQLLPATGEQFSSYDRMKIKSQWKTSALSNYEYKHGQSCFELNVECVSDEVCNKQLAKYLQVCQATGTQCNVKQCQAALQFFYENMPFNVAQMLTFCDCMPSDENCHQAKKVLHGKPCADHVVPVPSCLHIIQTCQADSFCWAKYENFTSNCLENITQTCLEDKACPPFVDGNDLICSDSNECRAAYINLLGSVLRVECTCDFTLVEDQSACKWIYHIFHSKCTFDQISGGKVDLPSSEEKSTSFDQ
ncbi:GDNF family receptor alpha-like isoform X1 [Anolis carolinensis]|uniref:GDNF family receptor alpha-like isoform X1 n=2 Tax=Anolis carolinensis TaxID=28377 RepID=UPI002F2B1CF8